MLSGKTDLQYLEEVREIITYFKESLKIEERRIPNLISFFSTLQLRKEIS